MGLAIGENNQPQKGAKRASINLRRLYLQI